MNIAYERPEPFSRYGTSIWTDPHVGAKMLELHLSQDTDAASRKLTTIRKTVDVISRMAGPAGRILDLGCGPGLYTEPLAASGCSVTGIDINHASIRYAEERNAKNRLGIRYIEGNYLANFPEGTYDLIMMIYCDMGTHSDDDRDILLERCRKALAPGGKLVFDVFDEGIVESRREGKSWDFCRGDGFWAEEEHLVLKQTFHYPERNLFADRYNILSGGRVRQFIVWERYYTEAEIIRTLETAGWRRVSVSRNLIDGNDFTPYGVMFVTAEN